jgi:hypothetical protein
MGILPDNIERWLGTPFVDTRFIYVDRWSIVHFLTGITLGFIAQFIYHPSHVWMRVFVGLIAYEILERIVSPWLFRQEKITDTVWDVIIGMLGFTIIRLLI